MDGSYITSKDGFHAVNDSNARKPFMVSAQASLDNLNAWLTHTGKTTTALDQFCAMQKIVVAGVEKPHSEDRWKRIKIGSVTFMSTELYGAPEGHPLAAVAQHRTGLHLRGFNLSIFADKEQIFFFGRIFTPTSKGVMRICDEVVVEDVV